MTGSQGCSCILSAPSLALIDHHVKKFDVAFISEHRLAVLRSKRYASDTRYFFLWRSREDETVDLCCAIIEARVPPVAFIDPRGSTWRGEDYEEPRRCRCVDCFIKFCATQTIFQQRRSIRAINQPVQWHRHGDPLHDSLFLVDRGSRANPRVVYLRKCTVTWPAVITIRQVGTKLPIQGSFRAYSAARDRCLSLFDWRGWESYPTDRKWILRLCYDIILD